MLSLDDYLHSLQDFDAAVCEAVAVSQASAGVFVKPNLGWAVSVFTRLCIHSVCLISAAPQSRWNSSDFDNWDFSCVAGHGRAIIEGYLTFVYLIEQSNEDEWYVKQNVMHLNDCVRRIRLHDNLGSPSSEIKKFRDQADELRERLRHSKYFNKLSSVTQKECLSGKWVHIISKGELLEKARFNKAEYQALYDLLSNYTHILPMSFYRIEPEGRGTGLENDVDRAYIYTLLDMCEQVMVGATDKMVEFFPNAVTSRQGINSKFSPGPIANLPKVPS